MSIVPPVNISIGVCPYFLAVHEYIPASHTRPKSHMRFGTPLHILLRLALSLSIFIIPLTLLCKGEYGSVVLPPMQ